MKKKFLLTVCAALAMLLCFSLGAFAYQCPYGDYSEIWRDGAMNAHDKAWITDWKADPAHAAALKQGMQEAKQALVDYYGLTPQDKYPAEFYASEEEYYDQSLLNGVAWEEYYLHTYQDDLYVEIDARGGEPGIINIMINDDFLAYVDARPQVVEQRVMVPFRLILEALGASVDFHASDNSIVAVYGDRVIAFAVDDNELRLTVNGEESVRVMDVAPYAEAGRTYVPVRFISEACGLEVNWIGEEQVVHIVDRAAYKEMFNRGFSEYNAFLNSELFAAMNELVYTDTSEGNLRVDMHLTQSFYNYDATGEDDQWDEGSIDVTFYSKDGQSVYGEVSFGGESDKYYLDTEYNMIYMQFPEYSRQLGYDNVWMVTPVGLIYELYDMPNYDKAYLGGTFYYSPFGEDMSGYTDVGSYISANAAYRSAVYYRDLWAFYLSQFFPYLNDAAFEVDGNTVKAAISFDKTVSQLEACYPELKDYDFLLRHIPDLGELNGTLVYDPEQRTITMDYSAQDTLKAHAVYTEDAMTMEYESPTYRTSGSITYTAVDSLPDAGEVFGENPLFVNEDLEPAEG